MTAQLTRYKTASFKEVAYLSLTCILVTFSASLMGFCDRLILARHSIQGLEAAVSALWLFQLLQAPFIRAVSMTQVFVGHYKGAGQFEKIGPCVWQMMWFSLLTLAVAGALRGPMGSFFFQELSLKEGHRCFNYLSIASFLFPLGTALSAFYLGQGETKKIIRVSLLCHAIHILLDFPLVFGVSDLIPSLGALGSTLASITAQFFFCSWLLIDFLRLRNRSTYATDQYAFKWISFWRYIRISLPRAAARIIQLTAWVTITRMIMGKGEDYAAVVVFGGTLQMFFSSLNEGMSQALTTIGAYIVGSQQSLIGKVIRSGCLFLAIESLVLAIPLLFFPEGVVALFFKDSPSLALKGFLLASCLWIWLGFLGEGLNQMSFALLSSHKDTIFLLGFSCSAWVLGYLPSYFLIHLRNAPPDRLWLIIACAAFITALIYFARLTKQVEGKLYSYSDTSLR